MPLGDRCLARVRIPEASCTTIAPYAPIDTNNWDAAWNSKLKYNSYYHQVHVVPLKSPELWAPGDGGVAFKFHLGVFSPISGAPSSTLRPTLMPARSSCLTTARTTGEGGNTLSLSEHQLNEGKSGKHLRR